MKLFYVEMRMQMIGEFFKNQNLKITKGIPTDSIYVDYEITNYDGIVKLWFASKSYDGPDQIIPEAIREFT